MKLKEKEELMPYGWLMLEKNRLIQKEYSFYLKGYHFVGYPGVFSPTIWKDTQFFSEEVVIGEGRTFLEIGCGSGVISVLAAIRGAKVTAVDINEVAVCNTQENARRHGVEDRLKVLKSDIFNALEGLKFDCIFWNVPFAHTDKKELSLLERAVFDPNYEMLERFLGEGNEYLLPSGVLMVGFSSLAGEFTALQSLAEKYFWRMELQAKKNLNRVVLDFDTQFELYCLRRKDK